MTDNSKSRDTIVRFLGGARDDYVPVYRVEYRNDYGVVVGSWDHCGAGGNRVDWPHGPELTD